MEKLSKDSNIKNNCVLNTEFTKENIKDKLLTKFNKQEYDYVKEFQFTNKMKEDAKEVIDQNKELITDKYLFTQDRNWNKFYKHNTMNFFKDRHYILAEFNELKQDNRVNIN